MRQRRPILLNSCEQSIEHSYRHPFPDQIYAFEPSSLRTAMASKGQLLRCLSRAKPATPRPRSLYQPFSNSSRTQTDGVFRALTSERVAEPWVEAFRRQQVSGNSSQQQSSQPQTPKDRDLSPRKMSDSYHRVVRTVSRVLYQLTD